MAEKEATLEQELAAAVADEKEQATPVPVPNEQQPEPTPAAVSPPPPPVYRQVAQEVGFQIPDGVDEKALFQQLFTGYTRGQQAQQHLQQVLPHWSEFQSWKQSQQQPKLQTQDENKPWYSQWHNPPEFDPRWRSQITKDLDGNLVPAPGAPPDVVQRYLAYEDYRQKIADKFTSNPYEFIEQPARHLAREEAKAVYQELLREQQEKQFIQQTVNAPEMSWVHQRDQKGNIVTDFSGKPVFTPYGQAYLQSVEELYQAGVPVHLQQKYALAAVQAEYARSPEYLQSLAQPQAQPGAAQAQANEQFHAKHEQTPNMQGILPGPAQGVTPPITGQYADARDLLQQTLKDYTDKDVEAFVHQRKAG